MVHLKPIFLHFELALVQSRVADVHPRAAILLLHQVEYLLQGDLKHLVPWPLILSKQLFRQLLAIAREKYFLQPT